MLLGQGENASPGRLEDEQCWHMEGVSKTMACCISAVLLALSRPYNVDSAHVTARECNEASPNLRCVHNRMVYLVHMPSNV